MLFLMVLEACQNEMQVLTTGIPIGTTQRHRWHPWVAYNSVDGEFMVLWNTSGSLWTEVILGLTLGLQSLDAQRVSIDGELLGSKIEISPPEGLNEEVTWKSMPKLAYNKFKNEYMIAYMIGYTYNRPSILLIPCIGHITMLSRG